MAPTPSPIPVQPSNSLSGRRLYHPRRQLLGSSLHPPGQSSISHPKQQLKPRIPDTVDGLQPSVALTPEPPQVMPWPPSESTVIGPLPSAAPVRSQPGDLPSNIVAAVAVAVLILGGLIGLVIGGEMLRRQAKKTTGHVSSARSGCFGTRKSKSIKNAVGTPQRMKTSREKFPYDEKTLTPLKRPPPVLKRNPQRRLSGVWPIRSLTRALCSRRLAPEQVKRRPQHSPQVASPQTTWSEFTPVSLYVASPRTVLDRIPEECEEDGESEASASRGSLLSDSVALTPCLENFCGRNSQGVGERCCGQGRRDVCKGGIKDEDNKSWGSSAPDMTSDGGESNRTSMVSLESLEDVNDRESLKGEVFELRRAQTTSMQMNKGVLLSLSLKMLDESQDLESTDGGLSRSGSPGYGGELEDGKDYVKVERELSLGMLGGTFSAVNLDEFPSPPSMLPVIPSFVSGFL